MDDRNIEMHLLVAQEESRQSASSPPAANDANVAKPPRTRLTNWVWEIGGILMSAALIGVHVVILSCYQGHRDPAWKYLSLNTLIAWISMVSRACIIFTASQVLSQLKWVWFATQHRPLEDLDGFDLASRGVLGSLALIYRVRARCVYQWTLSLFRY